MLTAEMLQVNGIKIKKLGRSAVHKSIELK